MTDDLVQRLRRTYRKEFPVTGSMIADNSNRLRPFPILATEVLFNPDGREAADRIEAQAAEIERLTKWKPIGTAPDDDWFLAAIEVRHKNGGHWWEYHVVWLDDETGDIHTDCEQGWSITDYSHWMALPDAPYPLNAARAALDAAGFEIREKNDG